MHPLKAQGEEKKAIQVALNLFEMGLSVDQVATATGLTIKHIQTIQGKDSSSE